MIFRSRIEEEEFFTTIRERIVSVAKKRIRGPDYEDIVQETMTIVKRKLSLIQSEDRLLPFVFQTLRNCVGNYYQKKKTEARHLSSSDTPESLKMPGEEAPVSDWPEIIEKALAVLEKSHERCAKLFRALLNQAEIEELQEMIGVSRENVYRTLYRCRVKLKEILTDTLRVSLP